MEFCHLALVIPIILSYLSIFQYISDETNTLEKAMLLAEMEQILLGLMILSLGSWLFLLLFWGQFWRVDQLLKPTTPATNKFTSLPKK